MLPDAHIPWVTTVRMIHDGENIAKRELTHSDEFGLRRVKEPRHSENVSVKKKYSVVGRVGVAHRVALSVYAINKSVFRVGYRVVVHIRL